VVKKQGKFEAKKLWVRINTFTTGISLRDEHFWNYMNVGLHPKARLTDVNGEKGVANETLEVNGIKKSIKITYSEKNNGYVAHFKIKASDFSLPPKSFLGISVNDEVSIEAAGIFYQQ
jgi:hypothetical protein